MISIINFSFQLKELFYFVCKAPPQLHVQTFAYKVEQIWFIEIYN